MTNINKIRDDLIAVSCYMRENAPFDFAKEHVKAITSLNSVIKEINKLVEITKNMQFVIEKMAEYISTTDIDEDICERQKHMTEFRECYTDEGKKIDCQHCIISYFKQEVGMK